MSSNIILRRTTDYAREIRQDLPPKVFRKCPERLLWLPVHLAVIAAAVTCMLGTDISLGWRLLLAATIGHSYACMGFLGHEILHQTVVKSRRLQNTLGTLCMLPLCLGPAHWRAWHNKLHHGKTTKPGEDPDSFGNIHMVRRNKLAHLIATFGPGSGYTRSWFFMFFWFTFQTVSVLFIHSKLYGYWTPSRRRRQLALFACMVGFWSSVLAVAGTFHFTFIYVLPMMVTNFVLLMYIATNHLFCDETIETNDPLANSLSVSVPRWMSLLHLNFGYHVEHHIFPYANPKYGPQVQAAILRRFGSRYRMLPLWKALYLLYKTPAVHLTSQELVNLRTGVVYQTLGPEGETPVEVERVPVPVRHRRRKKGPVDTTLKIFDENLGQAPSTASPDILPSSEPERMPLRRAA